MRELRIYKTPDDYKTLIYDKEKDSDSEKALWDIEAILYDLQPGEILKVFCVR